MKNKPIRHVLQVQSLVSPEEVTQIRREAQKIFGSERVLVLAGPIEYIPICKKRKPKLLTLNLRKK